MENSIIAGIFFSLFCLSVFVMGLPSEAPVKIAMKPSNQKQQILKAETREAPQAVKQFLSKPVQTRRYVMPNSPEELMPCTIFEKDHSLEYEKFGLQEYKRKNQLVNEIEKHPIFAPEDLSFGQHAYPVASA